MTTRESTGRSSIRWIATRELGSIAIGGASSDPYSSRKHLLPLDKGLAVKGCLLLRLLMVRSYLGVSGWRARSND